MSLIHQIRAKITRADQTLTVENAVDALTATRETDPGAIGDTESGKATQAKHPPKPKPKAKGKKP